MQNFTFDAASHTYRQAGIVLPGVTRVIDHAGLTNFENVRDDILERRGRLGTIVHRSCHYLDQLDLNWETVAEEAKGYVDSWANLCADLKMPKWRQIEFQCIGEIDGMKFGMQIDREGLIFGEESIIDIKISRAAERWHGVQLAGYVIGLPHQYLTTPLARFIGRRRYIAKLHEQGKKAKLIPYEDRRDFDVFRSGLVISHTKLLWGKRICQLEEAA
jgi:hypothetical protein